MTNLCSSALPIVRSGWMSLPRWRHNLALLMPPSRMPHRKQITVHIEPSTLSHASHSPCMPADVPEVPRRAGPIPTQLTRHHPENCIAAMKGEHAAAVLLLLMAVGASHALDDQVPLYEALGSVPHAHGGLA